MSRYRPGDIIEDYCVRCKRLMNHFVISTAGNAPAKVRCRTCQEDHDYRQEQRRLPNLSPMAATIARRVVEQRLRMESARAELARRVLETLAHGYPVPLNDAIQLRNWAVHPKDILLPLAEIARGILDQEENPNANPAENG
jgi:hypothetical protein